MLSANFNTSPDGNSCPQSNPHSARLGPGPGPKELAGSSLACKERLQPEPRGNPGHLGHLEGLEPLEGGKRGGEQVRKQASNKASQTPIFYE